MRKIVISIFVLFVATYCAATNTIKPYIKSINHTCLIVPIWINITFYRDLLGFKVVYDKRKMIQQKASQPALKLRNIVLLTKSLQVGA